MNELLKQDFKLAVFQTLTKYTDKLSNPVYF